MVDTVQNPFIGSSLEEAKSVGNLRKPGDTAFRLQLEFLYICY